MSLHTLSMAQALDIWGDLVAAEFGHASHGHMAEIYIYRLMPMSPAAISDGAGEFFDAIKRAHIVRANRTLYAILRRFERVRECHIYLGPRDRERQRRLGPWLRQAGEDHRVHVHVRRMRSKRK